VHVLIHQRRANLKALAVDDLNAIAWRGFNAGPDQRDFLRRNQDVCKAHMPRLIAVGIFQKEHIRLRMATPRPRSKETRTAAAAGFLTIR
jgi:hypothetical protein